MTVYIVDFQAFKNLTNEFFLKEVAITCVHSNVTYHWMISPPTRYSYLQPEFQSRVDFLTDNIHGIPWNTGYIEERVVLKKMRKILKDASFVYIKGGERCKYIQCLMKDYPHISVLDLDNFDHLFRNSVKIPHFRCHYNTPKHNRLRCALEQATRYRDILRKDFYSVYC